MQLAVHAHFTNASNDELGNWEPKSRMGIPRAMDLGENVGRVSCEKRFARLENAKGPSGPLLQRTLPFLRAVVAAPAAGAGDAVGGVAPWFGASFRPSSSAPRQCACSTSVRCSASLVSPISSQPDRCHRPGFASTDRIQQLLAHAGFDRT